MVYKCKWNYELISSFVNERFLHVIATYIYLIFE